MRAWLCSLALLLLGTAGNVSAAEPAFRTDGGDEKLRWYQHKPGEFPPEGSAHRISGELIEMDHVNRTGSLRIDRDDTQRRGNWDHPLPFTMLPYGSISYHGAPAAMRDIPIGTHLHGEFYIDKVAKDGKGEFDRAVRLEDDFSHAVRLKRVWRVDAVDTEKGTITCTGLNTETKQADAKPLIFHVTAATRVWKGRAIGAPADVKAGQEVLVNLTIATIKGPGRCTDIWVDAESRTAAAALQVEVHRQYQRERGLAGWVEAVDNEKGTVTVALFAGFDPKLREPFTVGASAGAAVAEENLRTYDQNNDIMRGPMLEVQNLPPAGLGDSGMRVKFKPSFLIEGYRPKRFVRLFYGGWKVDELPREEKLYQ